MVLNDDDGGGVGMWWRRGQRYSNLQTNTHRLYATITHVKTIQHTAMRIQTNTPIEWCIYAFSSHVHTSASEPPFSVSFLFCFIFTFSYSLSLLSISFFSPSTPLPCVRSFSLAVLCLVRTARWLSCPFLVTRARYRLFYVVRSYLIFEKDALLSPVYILVRPCRLPPPAFWAPTCARFFALALPLTLLTFVVLLIAPPLLIVLVDVGTVGHIHNGTEQTLLGLRRIPSFLSLTT